MADKSPLIIGVLGAGWLGFPLVENLVADGFSVRASSRNTDRLQQLSALGAGAYPVDLPHTLPDAFLRGLTHLVITLPPGGRQLQENTTAVYRERLAALVPHLRLNPALKVIYTSSTGVYGEARGTVDERTPPAPNTHSSRAVVTAEALLEESCAQLTVLRLAGLVGPGRHPGNFFGGKKIPLRKSAAPVNLVHRADVISAVRLALSSALPAGVYNVCASFHPPKSTFYVAAAGALGLTIAKIIPGGHDEKVIDSSRLRSFGWPAEHDNLDNFT